MKRPTYHKVNSVEQGAIFAPQIVLFYTVSQKKHPIFADNFAKY